MKLPDSVVVKWGLISDVRPEIAAALGSLCAEWSRTEMCLAYFFALLMGAEWGAQDEPAAFERITNFNDKCKIIEMLSRRNPKVDKATHEDVKDTLHELQDLAGKRAGYVHGRWGVADAYPGHLILIRRYTPRWRNEIELVDADTLTDVAKQIRERGRAIWKAMDAAFPRPKASGDAFPPEA